MSENNAVKQSLQEIATLLYYMYEHYLKDGTQGQCLDSLVAFLGDLGLMGNSISVFEAHLVYESVIAESVVARSGDSITYEQFYSWLRGVSAIYYGTKVDNSRKALHMMITQKIIPLASSWGTFRYSGCVRNEVKGSILLGMQKHLNFLRHWFFHLSHEPSQKIASDEDVWAKVVNDNSMISLSSLLHHLERIEVIPQKIESGVVKGFALQLVKIQLSLTDKEKPDAVVHVDKADEKRSLLSFADFVQIVGFMSAHIDVYANRFMPNTSPRNDGNDRSKGSYHVGWHVVVQSAAESFLHSALKKWLVYEFDNNKYISNGAVPVVPSQLSKEDNIGASNRALGMSPSSLLWICRQSNLMTSATAMHSLNLQINSAAVHYAEQKGGPRSVHTHLSQSGDSSLVPTSKIPGLLSLLSSQHAQRVAEEAPGDLDGNKKKPPTRPNSIIYQGDAHYLYAQSLIGSSDLATEASVVAMAVPSLFFVSPQPLPSLLAALYSPRGATCVHHLASGIQRVLAASGTLCLSDKPGHLHSRGENISLTKLVGLFHESSVVPSLVTDEVLLKMASYVLGREVECADTSANTPGSLLTERETIDLFFACSQVIFGGMTENFAPSADSIILMRHPSGDEGWKWQTSPSSDDKLRHVTSLSLTSSPHIAVADRVDRFCCLIELVDPVVNHVALLERLDINDAAQKKDLPYVIGATVNSLSAAGRAGGAPRIQASQSLNSVKKKSIESRMLGRLLGYIFSESSQWVALHFLNSFPSDGHDQPVSFFQNVLILIILQYPSTANSLSMTPWDVSDMLVTAAATRDDADYLKDSKQGFASLMMDLRFICGKYMISVDDFERFLSFLLLSPTSPEQSSSSSSALKLSISKLVPCFPYLVDIFSPTNLKLFQDGFPLLLWGFLSCCRGNGGHSASQQWYTSDRGGDVADYDIMKKVPKKYDIAKAHPLLENVTAIFPSRKLFLTRAEHGVVTLNAARSWALCQDVDPEICDTCFQLCVDITGDAVLHFSSFLIFSVICFQCQRKGSGVQDMDSSSLTTGQAASALLEKISNDIHFHQQISTSKLLASIILGASALTASHIENILLLSSEVFHQLQSMSKQLCQKRGLSDGVMVQMLPPRPPLKLWDVSRFIGFCKAVGVLSAIGSLADTWAMFGPVLLTAYPSASTKGWGEGVVGPLPLQVTAAKICQLLTHTPLRVESAEGLAPMENLFSVVQLHVVPFLSGFFDDLISNALLEEKKHRLETADFLSTYPDYTSILVAMKDASPTIPGASNPLHAVGVDATPLLLEDVLRYGGDRTVSALRLLSPWVQQVYEALKPTPQIASRGQLEPQSLSVSQYLASCKLLPVSVVSIIIKQAMSTRSRAVEFRSKVTMSFSDVGIALSEFEELLIRCAFSLWCDLDILEMTVSDNSDINKNVITIFDTMSSKFEHLSATLVGKYCEECRYSFRKHQKKNSSAWKRSGSAFQASFGKGSDFKEAQVSEDGGVSWGIDFLTPFLALLHDTASLPPPQEPLPPEQLFRTSTAAQAKALQREVPSVADVVDFQEKQTEPDTDTKQGVAEMLKSWGGGEPVRRNESNTFDATKGLSQMIESPISAHKPSVEVHSQSTGATSSDHFLAIPLAASSVRGSLSPPKRMGSSSADLSPHSIVSRSEEMLAHILAMRGPTPTPADESPLKTSEKAVLTSPLRQQQLRSSAQPASSPTQLHDMHAEGLIVTSLPLDVLALETTMSPFTPTPFTFSSTTSTPSPSTANNDELLEGTKEALWPVFATYCSCGDSSEPGKLSGPNLFALLSKLDLLTDETMISDLGVLLHQISAHSLSQTPSSVLSSAAHSGSEVEAEQSPLLSFEEFIVFLCAFAQLRFEGVVKLPAWTSPNKCNKEISKKEENWFAVCNSMYMSKSKAFAKLLEECVLPPLKKRLLLASPEDARHRDECSLIFSLETLFSIESVETSMLSLFRADRRNMQRHLDQTGSISSDVAPSLEDPIVAALARIKIIPQIVSEHEVMQLIADILPSISIHSNKTLGTSNMWIEMKFPQWQWVICVIAFKAVTFSIHKGQAQGKIKNLSSLVGEVITTMTAAMMT